MVGRRTKGFTLVELLVVVSIILLLVAMLAPAVGQALEHARRAACIANVREIARACKAYALAPNEHRGSKAQALPTVDPSTSNWSNKNHQCLWLLVKYDYVSPGTFICPSLNGYSPADDTTESNFGPKEFGYSFISMVGQTITLANAYTSLVIVADLNPRFEDDGSPIPGKGKETISESHKDGRGNPAGQNVGRLDETGEFLVVPKVTTNTNTNDWIYQSSNESNGKCGTNDVLLLR